MKKETRAKLRYLRMSPQKVRLAVDLIRGMKAQEAVCQLELLKKHAARPVWKLLNSAIANAKHNDQIKEETLLVKTAFVDGGPVLKRWTPKAHGRATPIRKRTSHITIILEGEVDEKVAVKIKKTEEALEANKAEDAKVDEDEPKKVEKKVSAKKEIKNDK